ncbi:MAG: hypothetical protein ABR548_01870 [Actinomycetota bacterium]|nr:hypothetical protein [Actinomycetota bacterium]
MRIDLLDHKRQKFWWLIQQPEAELCRKHPGFDEDLVVRGRTESLGRWHAGEASLAACLRDQTIEIEGTPKLVRAFRGLGGTSPFAKVQRAVANR